MDTSEASAVTEPPEEKPLKGDKIKNNFPSKSRGLKAAKNGLPNGNATTTNMKSKGKKDFPAGPKKAKVAKMDGETVKGEKPKKPAGTKSLEVKKDGESTLKNKQAKKKKTQNKDNNRMGKNKFKKLRKMLEKLDKE